MTTTTYDHVDQMRQIIEKAEFLEARKAARDKIKTLPPQDQFGYGLSLISQGFETKQNLLSVYYNQIASGREKKFFAHYQPMTPQSLISDINTQLPINKNTKIGVFFTAEWALNLRVQGYTDITLMTDVPCKATKIFAMILGIDHKTVDEIENMKFDIVVGNPPYGRGANLAIQFLNKAAKLSDVIYFVLPKSVRRPTRVNRISENLQLEIDTDVSDKAFGGPRTCWQKWVRSDQIRPKVERYTSHPDFEWLKKGDPRVNVFMGQAGQGLAGKVLTDGFSHYHHGHYFIHAKTQEVVQRLVGLSDSFRSQANQSVALPNMSKHDVIDLYVQRYSDKQV